MFKEIDINLKQKPSSYYQREIRKKLPKEVFKNNPQRLLWLFFHLLLIILWSSIIIYTQNILIRLVCSILIGNSLGTLGFLGHEILHGTVIRGKKTMIFLGGVCMLHWGLPPQVWIAWHNKQHHHHTNKWFDDPDCFGPVGMYKKSRWVQFMEKLTPGSGTKRSYVFLFYWFSLHTVYNIMKNPKAFKLEKNRKYGLMYFIGVFIVWLCVSSLLTNQGWLFLMLIPLTVSNFVMMSYVATNHFISPSTDNVVDPLINTLTVRSNKFVEKMHLQNNFHIEHHLFPDINPSQAEKVRNVLKERWPERYQEMQHIEALKLVYKTPRFYSKYTELENPRTGKKSETLLSHYLDI
ncbi:hypothetical protein COD94_06280 [Bacillus cereus]|nr:hypothetical protein COD94_06280 [Bacillus cereus]